jgi:hypothetical protein
MPSLHWPRADEIHRNLMRAVLFDLVAQCGGSFPDGVKAKDIKGMWRCDLLDYGQYLVDANAVGVDDKRRLLQILDTARPAEESRQPKSAQ